MISALISEVFTTILCLSIFVYGLNHSFDLPSEQESTECYNSDCKDCHTPECAKKMSYKSLSEESCNKNNALVLFQPTFLEPFRDKIREFYFVNRKIEIDQSWEENGVAAVVWDAAIVLSEFLQSQVTNEKLSLQDKSIIELGAGTGLVGLVAAFLGGDVTVTDRKSSLSILQKNIKKNIDTEQGTAAKVQVKSLDWGVHLEKYPNKFDIILGADIVYIEATFNELLETLLHLSGPRTLIFISCRIRYDRDLQFLDMMKTYFIVTKVLQEEERGIKVFEARLR